MKKLVVFFCVIFILAAMCGCTPPGEIIQTPEKYESSVSGEYRGTEFSGSFSRLGSRAFKIVFDTPESLKEVTLLYSEGVLSLSIGEISLEVNETQSVLPSNFPSEIFGEMLGLDERTDCNVSQEGEKICSTYEISAGTAKIIRNAETALLEQIQCEELGLTVEFEYTPAQMAAISATQTDAVPG